MNQKKTCLGCLTGLPLENGFHVSNRPECIAVNGSDYMLQLYCGYPMEPCPNQEPSETPKAA